VVLGFQFGAIALMLCSSPGLFTAGPFGSLGTGSSSGALRYRVGLHFLRMRAVWGISSDGFDRFVSSVTDAQIFRCHPERSLPSGFAGRKRVKDLCILILISTMSTS
jgi:hypothetical protein